MNDDDFADYWVQPPKKVGASTKPALQIDPIGSFEPLDIQMGIAEPKTVPDALYEPLFGQHSSATLHTYAVLDAAKISNLPELLENSGLKHRCLFKGDAYNDLKEVAPWIAQLEDGNVFTRNLFTRSNAPWHLWDQELGIYLRSSGALDDIWRHFRKFTKVQDEQGKWYYWRFWSGSFVRVLLNGGSSRATTARSIFRDMPVTAHSCTSTWKTFKANGPIVSGRQKLILDSKLLSELNEDVEKRNVDEELKPIFDALENLTSDIIYDKATILELRAWLIGRGFTQIKQRRQLFQILLEKDLLGSTGLPTSIQEMLADTSCGAGVRIWLLKNRTYN